MVGRWLDSLKRWGILPGWDISRVCWCWPQQCLDSPLFPGHQLELAIGVPGMWCLKTFECKA
eukprot:scaffold13056_cov14-Prasinocladus_malaysianus.AAC.1